MKRPARIYTEKRETPLIIKFVARTFPRFSAVTLSPSAMRFAQDIDSDVKDSLSFSHVLGIESNAVKSGFGDSIVEQLLVTHASVQNNSEDPTKKEGRVVCELVVTEGASGASQIC
jgi:hypothetical protein